MRAGIRGLPKGTFVKSMPVEIGGTDEPGKIQLALTIADDTITADFAGTSPQVRRPVNSPMNYTRAYVAVPLKMICDPELPNNEGTYRPLEIRAGHPHQSDLSAACFWRLALGTAVSGWSSASGLSRRTGPATPPDAAGVYVQRAAGAMAKVALTSMPGVWAASGVDGLGASASLQCANVSVEWSETETRYCSCVVAHHGLGRR
jgi:N-methylhydantoinase B/oxoprolinase/acetone carboxylase alpha subunit